MTWLDVLLPRHCAGCDRIALDVLCAECAASEASWWPDPADGVRWALALAPYVSGAAGALRRAKYGADRALARSLARWWARRVAPAAIGFQWLVPVPSPWTRRLDRGFAVSSLLARELSSVSGVPVRDALALGPGARQAGLSAANRAHNLHGRMRSVGPAPGRVLLVDDVLTTGTTIGAAARELLGDASREVSAVLLCAASRSAAPDAAPDSWGRGDR